MGKKTSILFIILLVLLGAFFVVDLTFGSVAIPVTEILRIVAGVADGDTTHATIIKDFRMTKAITCILAGSALALAGLQMQTLFRNALAGPDVLGLSSGASLAVALVFMSNAAGLTLFPASSPWSVAIAASLGCTAVFFIMLAVSRQVVNNVSLLIVGLMVGAGTSSIVSVLQFLSRAEEMQTFIIWTFGSLGGLNWEEIGVLTLILAVGSAISVFKMKSLNAWLLGENYAMTLGVQIKETRLWMIVSASLLTGGVTAFCGPIAFVGLAVPHLIKLLFRTMNHRTLIPAVLLGGAVLMLGCDIVSQLPANFILPINAITAMIGAPVVIWVIMRRTAQL